MADKRLPGVNNPPESACILRLSAIGDCCNLVPVIRTLQAHMPTTRLSWVVGRPEAALLEGLSGVELIVHDKRQGVRALRRRLGRRRFDLLLLMQLSLRAGVSSLAISARHRLGFDRARAKDLHGLFVRHRIREDGPAHVIDGFFGFCRALGIEERLPHWDIPIADEALASASELLPDGPPVLLISPCSSHAVRNWHADGYAAVARHALDAHGMRVAITGGGSALEAAMGRAIAGQLQDFPAGRVVNLVGRTDLKTLLAVMQRAAVVLAPDSGPVHMAMAAGTPAIGLYAETNPDRAAPVLCRQWVVNAYPQAVWQAFGKSVAEVRWGQRIGQPWAMRLITAEQVIARLDQLLATPVEARLRRSLHAPGAIAPGHA